MPVLVSDTVEIGSTRDLVCVSKNAMPVLVSDTVEIGSTPESKRFVCNCVYEQ